MTPNRDFTQILLPAEFKQLFYHVFNTPQSSLRDF